MKISTTTTSNALPIEWNVLRENWTKNAIEPYNVFEHVSFVIDLAAAIKKHKNEPVTLADQVARELRYYFWSKCEWEVVVEGWPPSKQTKGIKIDAYDQIMMNWPQFFDYIWEHKDEIQRIGTVWKRKWG